MKMGRIRALEKKFPPIGEIKAVMKNGEAIPVSLLTAETLPHVKRLEAPRNCNLTDFDFYLSMMQEAAFLPTCLNYGETI